MAPERPITQALRLLGGHVLLTTIVFAVIFAAAVVLDVARRLLEGRVLESGSLLLGALQWTEYGVLFIDLLLFFGIICKLSWRTFREI